ncbi:MAG: Hydroxymethylpyrimidine ABC transporter, ATPase component [Firmicutes bacterium]|nr:Hydroxymethylpyrimidine ABC transporter, ATPase component [Bacillota bacterium]
MVVDDIIVSLRDVTKKFHTLEGETEAIKDLSLDVRRGEFVTIVGPSGCGKTTLLSLISGLIKPSRGEILLNGEKINGTSGNVGYMLQEDHLFKWRTILQNVYIGLEIKGAMTPENKKRTELLLDKYGLGEFKNHYPHQLSGGMRQRVALIRTLAVDPDILLLDEPFAALDYQTRLKVSDDIAAIIKREAKTAIMVTHDIAEAISMADRVVVLSKRPAEVKTIHDIVLSCEERTPIKCREAPEFRIYFNRIWKELDVHV